MNPEAMRRACLEFRVKLRRDTGTRLTAAVCEELLGATFECEGEEVSLQSNPGLFYAALGVAIVAQVGGVDIPNHDTVAWRCFREAAEVHEHPVGMRVLAECLYRGRGVTEDPVQAAVWYQKAADMGDAVSEAFLGDLILHGDARAGLAKDASRGYALFREAVEHGHGPALFQLAQCYLTGEGVHKDASHGVTLMFEVIAQEGVMKADAQAALAHCYATGNGVEADTVQAALWCERGATGGSEQGIRLLPLIRKCHFCGTAPAHQLCGRCLKVRYCDVQCQRAHWSRETSPHKARCRRVVDASQEEEGRVASTTPAH